MGIPDKEKYLLMASTVAVVPALLAEQAVQKGQDRTVGRGVIDRGTNHQTVRLPQLCRRLVYLVVGEHAAARALTVAAADAAVDRSVADLDQLRLHAVLVQRPGHLLQGRVCTSRPVRASVDQ